MASGKIKKLVHLSQQTYLRNTRLVPDHNDKGYGLIEAEDGRDVYFPHDSKKDSLGHAERSLW